MRFAFRFAASVRCLFAATISVLAAAAQTTESFLGLPQVVNAPWTIRFKGPAAPRAFATSQTASGFTVETKPASAEADEVEVSLHLKLDQPVAGLAFDYAAVGDAAKTSLALFDAAANELWRSDAASEPSRRVVLDAAKARGQLVFRVRREKGVALREGSSHRISGLELRADQRKLPVAADGFTLVETLDELRGFLNQDGAKVRLKPGTYQVDKALYHHFLEFTGSDTRWDLRGVKIRIDTALFRRFGNVPGTGGFYCVFSIPGDRIELEGVTTENYGDLPGLQSRNKIFNLTGADIVVRDVDITTSGSSPWGYGSLYGISGGDVRKMNGIRIGFPARNAKLIGCRVHMRAMGHAIFVQGASDTLIQDCHVDGLLKSTNDILAETAGFAFERKFVARGRGYIEGTYVGDDGRILPDEMIALSEDGIRMYDQGGPRHPTGNTTIRDCTVTRMRRGICTGLGPGADTVINCEVRDSTAAGFNVGANDVLENCRADAKYAEALSLPYMDSRNARVELEILDSRGGIANTLLATVNGQSHQIVLRTKAAEFVPPALEIELGTRRGYASYQRDELVARDNRLVNDTPAHTILTPAATANQVTTKGAVVGDNGTNRVTRP